LARETGIEFQVERASALLGPVNEGGFGGGLQVLLPQLFDLLEVAFFSLLYRIRDVLRTENLFHNETLQAQALRLTVRMLALLVAFFSLLYLLE
jgi:hypothetical protein